MGLVLTTNDEKGTVVYRKDKVSSAGNAYSTFCIKVSSKNKNDEWESAFIDVVFKKADQEKITNKCKIAIKDSFPSLNTYNERTTIRWVIMDFDVLEDGEKKQEESSGKLDDSDSSSFMDITPDVAEELPFDVI